MIFTGKHSALKMITWGINNVCNFNCQYCPQQHDISKSSFLIDTEILSESLKFLDGEWLIYLTGGEPFLEKNIIEICKVITKRHFLSINTNLSTSNLFNFADKTDPARTLSISSSVHIGVRENRDLKLKSFIEKILYFQSKGFNIIASYVTHPVLFDRIKSDFEYLKSKGIQKVRIKIFRGVYKGKLYPQAFNPDQREFLNSMEADYPEIEILLNKHNYFGQLCAAGQNFFVMDRDGNLKRCSGTYRTYGNLFQNNMVEDIEMRPCPLKQCVCPYEGIRNASTSYASIDSLFTEQINQRYNKTKKVVRHILENPDSVKKKLLQYFT